MCIADWGSDVVLNATLNVMNNTIPVTAQLVEQQLEHRVTDAAAAASRQSDRYQAVCGQLFIAAPLAAPPGPPCPDCAAVMAAVSRTVTLPEHQPRYRRHRLLRWLRPTELVRRDTDR